MRQLSHSTHWYSLYSYNGSLGNSLTEAQIILFHKLCDLQSETAAEEMRAAYKVGFKDGMALMREVQE